MVVVVVVVVVALFLPRSFDFYFAVVVDYFCCYCVSFVIFLIGLVPIDEWLVLACGMFSIVSSR